MKILIVNGHGLMTAGKRRPDGLFREAFYNRKIARKMIADLLVEISTRNCWFQKMMIFLWLNELGV